MVAILMALSVVGLRAAQGRVNEVQCIANLRLTMRDISGYANNNDSN